MSSIETKKSMLETRPSMWRGTRRCRSVPHSTILAPSPVPTHGRHSTMTQNESVIATRPKGSVPSPHSPISQLR